MNSIIRVLAVTRILLANPPSIELMRFTRLNIKSLRGLDCIRQQYPGYRKDTND